MTTTAHTTKTIQMYRVYIKATPQAIWDRVDEEVRLRAAGRVRPTGRGARQ
jgi:hypothetical protein